MLSFPVDDAKNLIRLALNEDVRTGDFTSSWTLPKGQVQTAVLIAKENGIVAGLPIIPLVFEELSLLSGRNSERDEKYPVQIKVFFKDGDAVKLGDKIAEITGKTIDLLSGERVMLNFLQQLSGVATITGKFQTALDEGAKTAGVQPKTKVLDTRKTIPGFRTLQKYAVLAGGGANHRMGLWDMILIKDNHIAAAGGVLEALKAVKENNSQNLKVEIEVENLEQLKLVLGSKASNIPSAGTEGEISVGKFGNPENEGGVRVDRIMLDNMSDDLMREAVRIARENGDSVELEASGNINLERCKKIAGIGLDFVSVGALTHSVKALDISMRIV